MLRTFRSLRLGQMALAIASVLAVTGSLGLHPEPAAPFSQHAPDGITRWEKTQESDTASHDCLACLGHRSLTVLRLPAFSLQPGTAIDVAFRPRARRPLPAPARAHAGRAPPASA